MYCSDGIQQALRISTGSNSQKRDANREKNTSIRTKLGLGNRRPFWECLEIVVGYTVSVVGTQIKNTMLIGALESLKMPFGPLPWFMNLSSKVSSVSGPRILKSVVYHLPTSQVPIINWDD
jgi:hypothetical protein